MHAVRQRKFLSPEGSWRGWGSLDKSEYSATENNVSWNICRVTACGGGNGQGAEGHNVHGQGEIHEVKAVTMRKTRSADGDQGGGTGGHAESDPFGKGGMQYHNSTSASTCTGPGTTGA